MTSFKCLWSIFSCERFGISLKKHTRISLHFFAFNFIQLSELQETIEFRLDWLVEVLVFVSLSDKDTPSTYFHIEDSGVEILKLLTINKKHMGPNFVPWMTPTVIGSQHRMSKIHGIKHLRTPKFSKLFINVLYAMRSNALEKSEKQRQRWRPGEPSVNRVTQAKSIWIPFKASKLFSINFVPDILQ